MKIEPMNNTNEVARQNENLKDIDLDFIAHPATGDVVRKVGAAAIKRAMRNLVFLKAGEIPFNSRKGGSLHHTLFELYTPATVEILKRQLIELFLNYEPRVNVFQIEVEEDRSKNGLNIDINFEILNYNEPERLTLFIERVR